MNAKEINGEKKGGCTNKRIEKEKESRKKKEKREKRDKKIDN